MRPGDQATPFHVQRMCTLWFRGRNGTCVNLFAHIAHKLRFYALHDTSSITPCACARGKVIGSVSLSSVVCQHKIARSEDSGILMVGKHDHIVGSGEKLSFFCFWTVDTRHECYKLCDYVGHAYRPHLTRPCADSTAYARAQCR